MNILIDLVPTTVNIENVEYEINSDFRLSILFELLMQDNSIGEEDKIIQALQLYYPVIPPNINEAVEQMLWFYRCGKDEVKSKNINKGRNKGTQIYSYDYDDYLIYSAFKQIYSMDLQDIKYLHWWKFKALFQFLDEKCLFSKVMGYRSMDLSKIKDKEEKNYYRKMQELYKIPINKDEKEKLNQIEKILSNGGDLSKVL
ncbi:bacteriophage Gp15 family protein [Clostridium botulinum]|uniref:bacteriophage Gp15 family protein n=1 Tax=Clostridium botulinum TaxID=1491 RepID=UPI00174BD4DF|nr:bacteriophage Gp15 family protein [Clostridium botulinum]MBD5642775.1 bacteriophage Gp15 family protein [Clostridium botulinum]